LTEATPKTQIIGELVERLERAWEQTRSSDEQRGTQEEKGNGSPGWEYSPPGEVRSSGPGPCSFLSSDELKLLPVFESVLTEFGPDKTTEDFGFL